MKISFRKFIFIISLFVVFLAVLGGFLLTGSPYKQRKFLYDSKRAKYIVNLASKIGNYYKKHDRLPDDLIDLADINVDLNDYRDPLTGNLPGYKKAAEEKFKLCMTFATSNISESTKKYSGRHDYNYNKIKHPKGYHCADYYKKPKKNYFTLVN